MVKMTKLMKPSSLLVVVVVLLTSIACGVSVAWLLQPGRRLRSTTPTLSGTPMDAGDPAYPLVKAVEKWFAEPPNEPALDRFREQWPPTRIHAVLEHEQERARRSAVLALAVVGGRSSIDPLIRSLSDQSATVRQTADAAVWRIWFRLGSERANHLVTRAEKHAREGEIEEAFDCIDAAIEDSPEFAEAYNQRAILHFRSGAYERAIADCRRTLQLMPQHYGAMAGIGQCFMELKRFPEAIDALKRALEINPNLRLDRAIESLESKLRSRRQSA